VGRGPRQRAFVQAGIASAVVATALGAATATVTARPADLCSQVPIVNIQRNDLGFRAHWPTATHTGSRGHAKVSLSARTASGVMCEVNTAGAGILLSIGHRLIYSSHHAVMFGVPGNILKTHVRVKRTTDRSCPAGTIGTLTVFASYNGVHKDSVQLSFPAACRSHRDRYTGRSVTTNVPPN
jgi:hypothetical protein